MQGEPLLPGKSLPLVVRAPRDAAVTVSLPIDETLPWYIKLLMMTTQKDAIEQNIFDKKSNH